ncbi:MAG TPA: glutamine--fructose-6-phosphate transaminase (isomerizing) [archaeon]|nr:glutamine--fructose-6-phosphate transaminase (isomerizing) [archaeon]
MCGIFGYLGQQPASPILLEGIKRLEYRGYDSAGMVTKWNSLHLKKDAGKIDEINARLDFTDLPGKVGIAHTRWATHGAVTQTNAHPHMSNNGKIAVAHNGIVENYQELRDFLKENGFVFYTQTDTEIIPNLIEFEMRNGLDFEKACISSFRRLEGSYAIVVMCESEDKIVAARKESPLVLGVSETGLFVASDIPAFLPYTKKVIYLYDFDIAILSDTVKIFNLREDSFVERYVKTIEWDSEQAKKGEFDHFMLKEIAEQVDTVKRAITQERWMIEDFANEIKECEHVFFVAAGSSRYACMTASYIFSKIAEKHVDVVIASELSSFDKFLNDKSLVVAVSQSGETADVLSAVRIAREKGSKVISIVNVMGSSLTRLSDKFLLMNVGPEIGVVATKTFTAQVALLTLIAYTMANQYEEGKKRLDFLVNEIYNLTAESSRTRIKELANMLRYTNHILTIGRGPQYPISQEAALKIKEVSYIHAESFAGGELKHGSIALIEPGTPCIFFISEENEKECISNAMEVKARGGVIIGVSPKNNEVFDYFIRAREANSCTPIVQIIPIQILAYQLAVLRGNDPDKPRNLAKSVTVK